MAYITQELASERVACGVDILDEKRPGWFEAVDLDTFEIDSVYYCILAQVFGGYNAGTEALGGITGCLYGFDAGPDDYMSEDGPEEAFALLRNEWHDAVKARQAD